jgi:hypothetical protein
VFDPDSILFVNDVYLCAGELLRLLLHDTDVACAMDWVFYTRNETAAYHERLNFYDYWWAAGAGGGGGDDSSACRNMSAWPGSTGPESGTGAGSGPGAGTGAVLAGAGLIVCWWPHVPRRVMRDIEGVRAPEEWPYTSHYNSYELMKAGRCCCPSEGHLVAAYGLAVVL